jgi:hypothetical protein
LVTRAGTTAVSGDSFMPAKVLKQPRCLMLVARKLQARLCIGALAWKGVDVASGGALGVTALAGATGGLGLGLAVFAGAVGAFVGTEGRRYRRDIRPGLARVLLRTPVTTWVLSRWVRLNGRLAGRLWRFDLAIETDRALYALSMLASAAIAIGELDDP